MKLIDHFLRKPLYVAFGQALQGGGITSVDLVAARDATTVTITASDGSAAPIAGADASTAGVLTAVDKSKLDGLSSATARDFATKLDVATSMIGAGITHLRTAGHSAAGDGGDTLYKRVATAPSHALKVQSADGAWWEIVPNNNIIPFQACGGIEGDNAANGATNVTAFNDFIGYCQDVGTDVIFFSSGPTLFFPEGIYHFNTHLNLKATIHMLGVAGAGRSLRSGSALQFPADSYGLIIHDTDTIDLTTEAVTKAGGGSIIERLWIKGGGNTGTTGSGIWMRKACLVKNCYMELFAEDGVRILAGAGSGGATEGNANVWRLEGVVCENNGGNGLFVDLADTNAGLCMGGDFSSNGRWGIFDSSFLGNTYIGVHTAINGVALAGGNPAGNSSRVEQGGMLYMANAAASEADLVATTPGTDETVWIADVAGSSGSFVPTWLAAQPAGTYFHGGPYRTDNANARNVLLGCYIELNQNRAQLVKPTTVFGGNMGVPRGTFAGLIDGVLFGSIKNKNILDAAAPRAVTLTMNEGVLNFTVEGDHSKGLNLITWDETAKHILIGEHGNLGARRPMRFTTDMNTKAHGRSSPQLGGEIYFYKGFWIGNGSTQSKHFGGFRSKPTSGDAARGDKTWNFNPTIPGDPAGWRFTTGGDIATTAVLEEFFYLTDLPGDHPGYNIRPKSDGSNRVQWREAAKAGTDTIADTASTIAVAFASAFASANYSVALSADGDERVWVTLKTASGFTINRAATIGARTIDWTVTPHEDL